MTETTAPATKTPWHLWVVGIISLLWNCTGAMDFTLTNLRNATYLKALTPEQLAYFGGIPSWVVAAWGIATWGGVLGSLLLLFRRCAAVWVFLVSLICMVLTNIYTYVLSDGLKVMKGADAVLFSLLIFVICVLLLLYARAMRSRGVLR